MLYLRRRVMCAGADQDIWFTIKTYAPEITRSRFRDFYDERVHAILWSQLFAKSRVDGGNTKYGRFEMLYTDKDGKLRSYQYDGLADELMEHINDQYEYDGYFTYERCNEQTARAAVHEISVRFAKLAGV